MTCRWGIFFSLIAVMCLAREAEATGGVAGTVQLRDSRERSVEHGHDLSGVVVFLEPVGSRAPEPARPMSATMRQKNKRFIPHVLAVRRGTQVDFPNQDPT